MAKNTNTRKQAAKPRELNTAEKFFIEEHARKGISAEQILKDLQAEGVSIQQVEAVIASIPPRKPGFLVNNGTVAMTPERAKADDDIHKANANQPPLRHPRMSSKDFTDWNKQR